MISTPISTERMREFASIIFERNVSDQAIELSETLRRSADELDALRLKIGMLIDLCSGTIPPTREEVLKWLQSLPLLQ